MRRITLLTDFGTADGYVAAMKGVIAAIAPAAIIDDASHDIPPGDVGAAAWALGAYWRSYPPGTVHVAVVDPGVGSSRRALALSVDHRFIITPDNGLVTAVLMESPAAAIVEIRNPAVICASISATFHGRDVFAPAAAHVSRGMKLQEIGPAVDDIVELPQPRVVRVDGAITGTVVHVDRFGSLITNIHRDGVSGGVVELDGGAAAPVRRTYADVASGELVALIGSRGLLEVSVRDGSAAASTGCERGTGVVWRPDG